VVGGGICGSTTAATLAQAGWAVSLVQAKGVHEQHLAAALTPVISSDDNARSRLSRLGARLADQYWRGLTADIGLPCGALQLQRAPGAKRVQDLQAQVQTFNQPDWARWVEREEASELAGIDVPRGGVWFAGGWLIKTPALIDALQATPGVNCVNAHVARIEQIGGAWRAIDELGDVVAQADVAVLANAFDALALLKRSQRDDVLAACRRLPALHRLAGEITLLPANELGGGPKCIVGGDGYVLPAVAGWCVSGGTYVRDAQAANCTELGRQANIERAGELVGLKLDLKAWPDLPGWAGWRAVLPGRLPAIGELPHAQNLWVFTAGASRGLTWSVLGAKLIADGLAGEPSDLDAEMMQAVAP